MKRTRSTSATIVAEASAAPASAQALPSNLPPVERIPMDSITPAAFRERFLVPNIPVVLTGVAQNWRAAREWVHADGSPNVDFLSAAFGDSEVPVVDSVGTRSEMSLREYAAWWRSRDERLLYLKDWHFAAHHAEYDAYDTPPQFAEDWLNEHWEALNLTSDVRQDCGDHRFVYLGPQGSRTALHADVFFSYSWSVNIAGRKRWLLVPAAGRKQAHAHGFGHGQFAADHRSQLQMLFPGRMSPYNRGTWCPERRKLVKPVREALPHLSRAPYPDRSAMRLHRR